MLPMSADGTSATLLAGRDMPACRPFADIAGHRTRQPNLPNPEVERDRLLGVAQLHFAAPGFSHNGSTWPKNASSAGSPLFSRPMWSATAG